MGEVHVVPESVVSDRYPLREILLELLFGRNYGRTSDCSQVRSIQVARQEAGSVFGLTEAEFDRALEDPIIQEALG